MEKGKYVMEKYLQEKLTELRSLNLGIREYSRQATCLVSTFLREATFEEISMKHYEIMGERL